MEINNTKIEVEKQSINPMLKIWVYLNFDSSFEIPISISGKLCHENGQIISILNEYQLNTDSAYSLTIKTEQEQNSQERRQTRHSVQLSALLTPRAIESIEDQREKQKNKSANFYMEFVVKTLTAPTRFNNLQSEDINQLNIKRDHSRLSIEQSDWVTNFSPTLGIGDFLLLELNITDKEITDFWKKLIGLLKLNILEMEKSIRQGEWKKTIEYSRQFFDGLNIKNTRNTDAPFESEFRKILQAEQHNEEGINDFLNSIKALYDFSSKYVHPKDRKGLTKPYPNAKKEDAYFVYTLSIGLMNLIISKIQK